MKKILLLIFSLAFLTSFGQSLTPTRIIFETNDHITLQNGKEYEIVGNLVAENVEDPTIFQIHNVLGHQLPLRRVLVVIRNDEYFQLIEWRLERTVYYQRRNIQNPFKPMLFSSTINEE